MSDAKSPIKLTAANAKTLPVGEYPDSEPGLKLIVTEKARTWSVFKWSRALGKPIRRRIGDANEMGPAEARRLAEAVKVEINGGEHLTRGMKAQEVADKLRADSARPTLRRLAEAYTTQRRQKGFKTASWAEDTLERHYSEWMDKPVEALTRDDVIARQDYLLTLKKGKAKESKGQAAARAKKALQAVFTLAKKQKTYLGEDMSEHAEAPPANARSTYLKPAQETKVLEVLDAWEEHGLQPWVAPFFKLALLTGARRSNLGSMRFDELELEGDDAGWLIPKGKFKSKREHFISLTPEAVEIIRAQKEAHPESPWVFPASTKRSQTGHLTDPWSAWQGVLAAAEVSGVTIHDLRRTVISKLASAGVPLKHAAEFAGHADSRVTEKVYIQLERSAVRSSVNKALRNAA